jgi:diguanylate cyclase (GGDEF)-like protein/PAS domain S-box-containing protein
VSCDLNGNILYVNQKAAETLGSPSVEEAKKINLLTFPLLLEQGFSAKLKECLLSRQSIIDEFQYKSKKGKKVWLRIHIKSWMDLDKITGAQIVIDDISEKKQMEEELRSLSVTDFLTNTYNRRYFIGQLENEIERSKRFSGVFSLIMFDLDHFKRVNDTYGHNAGDVLLRSVTDTVKDSIRKIDCLARWGGEEFILLIPGTPAQKAVILAERLRIKISEIDNPEICKITASFGVTEFCTGDTVDALIQKADALTYSAKAAGRNRVAV